MKIRNILCAFIIGVCMLGNSISVNAAEGNKGIILIDPGHGGIDGGAKGKSGINEKDINLAISQKLKDSLESQGYSVFMTREDDTELNKGKASDLEARCKMKKDTKCDVFISIHQNKFGMERCYGAQVWYANNEDSTNLATSIQNCLRSSVDDNNKRIAKPANQQYKILRDGYNGACVIVECGFLSNYNEEKRLQTDEHQNKIVDGITKGVNEYFQSKK